MKKENKFLQLPSLPFDITSHQSLCAVSNIDGEITFLQFGDEEITAIDTIKHHTESCRRLIFSGAAGETLLSISSDKTLVHCDVETRKVVKKYENEYPLYALCEVRSGNLFATGDDEGTLKVWDLRKEDPILMKQPEHDNFISALSVDSSGSTLLATSGDGRLSVWNSRQRKLIARSDECDSELLTCTIVHAGNKVVCGDAVGVLNVYSWDDWGDISDRIPVQEDVSVDVVLEYSPDVLVLGCMDGVVRATSLFPHIPLPHIGDHADNAIEGLCLSPDQTEILSIGHDCVVRAWSVDQLDESLSKLADKSDSSEKESEDEDSESEDEKPRKKKKMKHISSNEVKSKQSAAFFNDLA